jgi:uncharacterized membrane protein YidH (DUF202 family)
MKTKSLIIFATIIILLSVFLAPLAYKEYFENENEKAKSKSKLSTGTIILIIIGSVVGGIGIILFLFLGGIGVSGK